ncbi:MAG TPA: L,D-transpeptidase family protein [Phycisphaerales bacterium]|nr:L,D-transpeptidase family protein [Phycisphaerales bacterium]
MVLPSQSARPKSRHSHMYRGRRGGRRPMIFVLLGLLVVSYGAWRFLGPNRAQSLAAEMTTNDGEALADTLAANPPRESTPTRQTPQPEPARTSPPPQQPTIQMGGGQTSPPRSSPATNAPTLVPETSPIQPPAKASPSQPERDTTNPQRARALERMRAGMDMLAANRPIEARRMLTQALESEGMDAVNAKRIRESLTQLNERLVFSPEVVQGDPFSAAYVVRSGDALARIATGQNLHVDWRFIQRINRIQRPESIRVGQTLKLVRGPFHAVVHKREFRMDIYLGEGADRVYVRSFPVGLGEYDSTPVGLFRVRPNSKLINPAWTNPRTGQSYHADDPQNPIGERWIGLEGVSESVRDLGGYGIHGTIEPQSIGTQASMGCVRMLAADVELVYEMLVEEKSSVRITDETTP